MADFFGTYFKNVAIRPELRELYGFEHHLLLQFFHFFRLKMISQHIGRLVLKHQGEGWSIQKSAEALDISESSIKRFRRNFTLRCEAVSPEEAVAIPPALLLLKMYYFSSLLYQVYS